MCLVPANQRLTGPMWPSAARWPTSAESRLPHRRAHQRLGREQVDALVAAPLLVARDGGEHLALHLLRVGGGVEQRPRGGERLGVVDVGRGDGGHSKLRSIRVPSESQFSRTRSAVVLTSLAAAAAMIASCWRTERAPGERAEAQPLQPPQPRHQPVQRPRSSALARRVQRARRGSRRRRPARRRRRRRCSASREARVGVAHRLEVGGGEARHAELGRQRVQRGDDRERVPRRPPVQRRDAREPLRLGLHQPVLLEPAQRLAHRRPAQPEPRAQLLVAQPLPGRERPVDDRVPHAA